MHLFQVGCLGERQGLDPEGLKGDSHPDFNVLENRSEADAPVC